MARVAPGISEHPGLPHPEREVTGLVNKVLTHSFVDGPGNRAVVFLQGCSFHCLYCHNPQTINRCNTCGVCIEYCPDNALSLADGQIHWDPALCQECDTCIQVCPNYSTPRARQMTPNELWGEIKPYAAFLSGITVSGGEPMRQFDFLVRFFSVVKNASKLTTFVETNGCASINRLRHLLPLLDGAMVDLKAMDPGVHRELTGQENAQVKQTIGFLARHHKLFAVRVTVVPEYTDTVENAIATARFVAALDPHIRLRFSRFRPHGTRGAATTWESPPEALMDELVAAARAEGVLNVSRSI